MAREMNKALGRKLSLITVAKLSGQIGKKKRSVSLKRIDLTYLITVNRGDGHGSNLIKPLATCFDQYFQSLSRKSEQVRVSHCITLTWIKRINRIVYPE